MKRLIFIPIILLGLTAGQIFAQGNLAQAGANFLQISVEPRGAALGGAVAAVAEGAPALYWNPAGAVYAENMDFYFSHTNWYLDTQLMYGAVVKNMGEWGALGVSFTSFYMDEMEITTVYNSEGTGEYYDAGDLAVGLSYARSLTDRFTFGITVKYVREFIWNESASQMAVDVGSLYRTDFMNLRLGMAVRNFGGKMKFSGEDIDQRLQEELDRQQDNNPRVERLSPEFRLPQVFQMGLAFDPVESENARLTLLADVDVPSDNTQRMIVAAEFNFRDLAYLRGGYRFNYDEGALSLGGGLYINAGGLMTRLDYAFSARGVFGNVHQFGLGFSL